MERRSCTRKNLYQSIDLQVPSYNQRVVAATLIDISLSGAFIGTQVLLPADGALVLELQLPGNAVQNRFHLNARTVRRTARGVGVAFVDLPADAGNALSKTLSHPYEKQPESFKPDRFC